MSTKIPMATVSPSSLGGGGGGEDDGLLDGGLLEGYCGSALTLMRLTLESMRAASDEGDRAALEAQIESLRGQLLDDAEACNARGIEPPDQRLAQVFGLSPLELLALWLAALPWIESEQRGLIAEVYGEGSRDYVTVELCQRVFCRDREGRRVLWRLAQPSHALRRSGVLRLLPRDGDPNPLRQEMVLSSDVLGLLQGVRQLGADLEPYGRWVASTPQQAARYALPAAPLADLAALLEAYWSTPESVTPWRREMGGRAVPAGLAVVVRGPEGVGRTSALEAMCGRLGRAAIVVEGEHFRGLSRPDVTSALQAMAREATLFGELVIVRHAEVLVAPGAPPLAAILAEVLRELPAAVALCLSEHAPLAPVLEPLVVWRLLLDGHIDRSLRSAVWAAHWSSDGEDGEPIDFDRLDSRYALSPVQVGRAARAASLLRARHGGDKGAQILDRASRNQIESNLGELVVPMPATRGLDSLILDDESMQRVIDVIEAARNRDRVLHDWGLGETIRSGLGLCCLFDGEPGTGKTLSAEVIAYELGLQLMRINTGQLFDKYIGETEKNLERVFSRARPTAHLLLFDEADALFSKRTAVKGSNDRYSNMNVGVLLQLVEGYDGVVVLTTNLKNNIDKAFERRIMFKLSFPLPEPPERARLWRLMLPPEIPTAGALDFEVLGEIEIAGGEIKNAVMHAAYDAARRGKLLSMDMLLDAAYRIVADAGRLVRQEDEVAW